MDVNIARIEIKPIPNVADNKVMAIASTHFEAQEVDGIGDKLLSQQRAELEGGLSLFADMAAVASNGSRLIESVKPFFCLSWPDGSNPKIGTDWQTPTFKLRPRWSLQQVGLQELADLKDRPQGIALMAEAVSTEHEVGRFIGLCRVLEHAFKSPFPQLPDSLVDFLKPTGLQYFRDEINQWVNHRGGAAHGDLARANYHVFDRHVRSASFRLEQAAMDVLMNKAIWHSTDTTRMERWRPSNAILHSGDIRGVEHKEIGLSFALVDPFTGWNIAGDCKIDPKGNVAFPNGSVTLDFKFDVVPR